MQKKIKTIMQTQRRCYLCGRNGQADKLDLHHIFPQALRENSEKYGLVVFLCHERCHIFGENAVHANAKTMRQLQHEAQEKAMAHYGWTEAEWLELFRRNY